MVVVHGVRVATPPLTEQAADLDRVWRLFLVIALGVGALVAGLLVWVVLRYRHRRDELPPQHRYNIPVEVLYTIVPLVIVGALFVVTVRSIDRTVALTGDPDVVVEVTAYQWQWQFDYPEAGARSVAVDGESPELVLPANSTVRFELTSRDVLHSFWIPGFRFKRDVFPGETTEFQVDVGDRVGVYPDTGSCAEFCGIDHHKMRFTVRIVSPAEFADWSATHPAPVEVSP